MSLELIVLGSAAFGLVAAGAAATSALALPLVDGAVTRLAPRLRVRVLLALGAAPALLAAITVLATLLPAFGLGSDHCIAHEPSHPHLCPHHGVDAPSQLLIAIALAVALRLLFVAARSTRSLLLGASTARALQLGSEGHAEVRVFDADAPEAFVLGVLRPAVYASRALFGLAPPVAAAVLAHERAHVRAGDLAWRVVFPALAAFHFPHVARALGEHLAMAQELVADDEAAREVGDPLLVAEALLLLSRVGARLGHGIAFAEGDVATRVQALLAGNTHAPARTGLVPSLLLAGAALAPIALNELVHHTLEILLGALS